ARRMVGLRGGAEAVTEEHMMPLWVANTYVHVGVDSADSLMTVLLSYAATEGLLLRKEDQDSRLGPRLSLLIATDGVEQRRLRKLVARWTELRGYAAHGQRPPVGAVAKFLEEDPSALPAGAFFGLDTVRQAAAIRASNVLRRVFLAFLFSMFSLDEYGRPVPHLSRNEVLELLEKAAQGDSHAAAHIVAEVPQAVREMAE
ncbi:MAG TPA: hypothetical protein VGB13_09605, partial [Candidatus Krumholzibacteria bacterium]